MKLVTVSSKNQITIPKEMLFAFGIKPSEKLLIEKEEDKLILTPMKTSIVEQVAGSLNRFIHPSKFGKSFKEIMEVTKKKVAKKLAANL